MQIMLRSNLARMRSPLVEGDQHSVKLCKRVEEQKAVVSGIVENKIRAVSVCESVEAASKELEMDKEASGGEGAPCGQGLIYKVDRGANEPERQTLSQRLSSIVHSAEHPVGVEFVTFCQRLKLKCRQILRNVESLSLGPSMKFLTSFDDFYVIGYQDVGANKMFLEEQRALIHDHISHMADMLAEAFGDCCVAFVRKLRVCYEKCFYDRVGRDLLLVYRVVNGKSMMTLERNVHILKELPVSRLGLQMKDEWWLQLFEPESVAAIRRAVSVVSCDSECGRLAEDDETVADVKEKTYRADSEKKGRFSRLVGENVMFAKNGRRRCTSKLLSRSLSSIQDTGSYCATTIEFVTPGMACMDLEISDRTAIQMMPCNQDMTTRDVGHQRSGGRDGDRQFAYMQRWHSSGEVGQASDGDRNVRSFCRQVISQRRVSKLDNRDSFQVHFGSALEAIRGIFVNSSPLTKTQCLTSAVQIVACKVEELRMRGTDPNTLNRENVAVTAEDLLPLLVLMLLKLPPHDVAKLYCELLFVSDFMADFLSTGCHSYALTEMQIALKVLEQTCEELAL